VETSHAKIKSYINDQKSDARQMQAVLRRLHEITEREDVASLVLLLKEMIPDYNPGSKLLRAALLSRPKQPSPTPPNKQQPASLPDTAFLALTSGSNPIPDAESFNRSLQL
jgi:hypothetical protein